MSADVTEAELRARANRAAADILARLELQGPRLLDYATLVSLLKVGWLEGWQAGADQVRDLLRESFDAFVQEYSSAAGPTITAENVRDPGGQWRPR